jgi:hypothetical protein
MLTLFPGCGEEQVKSPDGSTIEFNPTSFTQAGIINDQVLNLSLIIRYPDGSPMPKAIVKVVGNRAVPDPTGSYQFYYYPDAFQNPNNLPVDSGFLAQTDDFGTYNFSVAIFSQVTFSVGSTLIYSRIIFPQRLIGFCSINIEITQ